MGAEFPHGPDKKLETATAHSVVVAAVEGPGIAGEERAHGPCQGTAPRTYEEVGMIGEEGPGACRQGTLLRRVGQAGDEVRAVGVGAAWR
jgi:hypothetical protein